MVESVNVKFKLTKGKLKVILILALLVVGVFIYLRLTSCDGPIYKTCIKFRGITYNFRIDLRDAQKIQVFPNESAVHSEFNYDRLVKITIGYNPKSEDISVITVEAVEVVNKLKLYYLSDPGRSFDVSFNDLKVIPNSNVTTYPENPLIIIKTPSESTKTQVSLVNHTLTIEGTSLKNLDLATIKFISVAMGLKV